MPQSIPSPANDDLPLPLPVAPGIESLRLPLPFALDHINVWLIKDGPGWALVDTGIGTEESCALWERLLAGPLAGRRFTRLICTHFHPDHMGLAGWLTERLGIPLTTSRGEWAEGRDGWFVATADRIDAKLGHYRRLGFTEAQIEPLRRAGSVYRSRISPPPEQFEAVADGDSVSIDGAEWRVMTFGGHSPEHVCLWCPERSILVAGDQILPTISPVVGVWPDSAESADPLALFLAGLERLARLPADTLALPAHGAAFRTLGERCAALAEHHRDRLAKITAACDAPATVTGIVGRVFTRPLDAHQTAFAAAEILAHLVPLVAERRVIRDDSGSGTWTFTRAAGG